MWVGDNVSNAKEVDENIISRNLKAKGLKRGNKPKEFVWGLQIAQQLKVLATQTKDMVSVRSQGFHIMQGDYQLLLAVKFSDLHICAMACSLALPNN